MTIGESYSPDVQVTLYTGDCRELLAQIPTGSVRLVITSPPYNIGKRYEKRRNLEDYLREQDEVISRCVDLVAPDGSICWQVGNHIAGSQEILPLDIALFPLFAKHGLKLRNKIVWHFEHGLHCSKRFSGRYETILWFTKGAKYVYNLDPVRVPQKYPAKRYFKGPRAGDYSCNPQGKNPGDVWIFPNVKHNHIEKTIHPCQFPVELVERLALALTNEGDLILDPYMGVGSTAVAAVRHGRRAAGADIVPEYIAIARERVNLAALGLLKTRPMNRPIYEAPNGNGNGNGSIMREDRTKHDPEAVEPTMALPLPI